MTRFVMKCNCGYNDWDFWIEYDKAEKPFLIIRRRTASGGRWNTRIEEYFLSPKRLEQLEIIRDDTYPNDAERTIRVLDLTDEWDEENEG